MHKRVQRGFTLIELLCSLCIILILVGLLIGPVFKAFKKVKRLQGETTAWELIDRFQERMTKHFGLAESYPARTAEELYAAGYIDGNIRDFFRKKEVKFIPFSSSTPEVAPILMVEVSPGEIVTVLKADIRPKN